MTPNFGEKTEMNAVWKSQMGHLGLIRRKRLALSLSKFKPNDFLKIFLLKYS